eukprot:jgi/Mesvir1/8866/Mv02760-RA.2
MSAPAQAPSFGTGHPQQRPVNSDAFIEFQLERVGYLPFDELSQITGIGFVWQKALVFMSVEGFQWFGSGNVTFFSPAGSTLTVLKPTDTTVTLYYQEAGSAAPVVMYQGLETGVGMNLTTDLTLSAMQAQNIPLTVQNFFTFVAGTYYVDNLPVMCAQQGITWLSGNLSDVHETCAVAIMSVFQGFGVVEAAVGPQDYFGTEMTKEEAGQLSKGDQFTRKNLFDPDITEYKIRFSTIVQSRIDARQHS